MGGQRQKKQKEVFDLNKSKVSVAYDGLSLVVKVNPKGVGALASKIVPLMRHADQSSIEVVFNPEDQHRLKIREGGLFAEELVFITPSRRY